MPNEMFILSWWFSTFIFQNSLHSVGNSCLTPLPTTPNAFWVVKKEERKNACESQILVTALRITDSGHGFANHRFWSRLCESQILVTALRITDSGHGFANHRLWSRLWWYTMRVAYQPSSIFSDYDITALSYRDQCLILHCSKYCTTVLLKYRNGMTLESW